MTYILLIFINSEIEKVIGRLGRIKLKLGYYAYVGSAKLNFEHRIRRHLKKVKKLFWHIDYILADEKSQIESVFYTDKVVEHKVAMQLHRFGFEVVEKFGSSDCNCPGHLFYLGDKRRVEKLWLDLGFKKFL
ncbi:MAG: GIY-YIG nuclease family protein [Candidatus Kryptonium sp.]|nr:GIY-YIG nuclease family protein [Candidatus Kryptonium sp.]MDW8109835.1 GIY-YIG nuclease family protein [Candidatus Kryptonium sp.]